MSKCKRLKDPIYGYISIPLNYMVDIVDTATFQRLRRIIQTSYAPLYSSAVHKRFVHSLGVYHLGTIAAQTLEGEIKKYIPEVDSKQLDRMIEIFLLACLLHDVGHAPFSHTGEKLYLDGEGEYRYVKLHKTLKKTVDSASFEKDIPTNANVSAAPHEIMSAIVGINAFSKYMTTPEDRELFARCITGYQYSEKTKSAAVKNCFISLLNSKVIDVDKLDYLIRDAYTTGFNTVNIDYERLLRALTVLDTGSEISLAYYKDAVSVLENVVYAHDAEKKWIQNHPIVLYECYILNHVFQGLSDCLDTSKHKLFSYESLTPEGHTLKRKVKISLLCDDDIIYLMKNVFPSEISKEYFQRCNRRHPVWKSEAEYEALFSGALGGPNDSIKEFEYAMNATASYLLSASDTWVINDDTMKKLSDELSLLDSKNLDELSKSIQEKDKRAALNLMNCLLDFADGHGCAHDFVIIEASQFNSGFSKPDFSKTKLIFSSSENEIVPSDFGTVAKPLQSNHPERKKFYYLFYRRKEGSADIDKVELCKYLVSKFATLNTFKRGD